MLAPEYEQAIVDYREEHHGMVMGMTRFRDHTDDMPCVGYGWGTLSYDRTETFHAILAGHSANYLSRGAFGGTEQRSIYGVVEHRWRNDCADGGEDCSLCMVSSVAPAMWIRWMLVQEAPDPVSGSTGADGPAVIHIARGAPRRWFSNSSSFGISNAPTRQGRVSFSIVATSVGSSGWVALAANPGAAPKIGGGLRFISVRVRPATEGSAAPLHVSAVGATVAKVDAAGGVALLRFGGNANVTFEASTRTASTLKMDDGPSSRERACPSAGKNWTVYPSHCMSEEPPSPKPGARNRCSGNVAKGSCPNVSLEACVKFVAQRCESMPGCRSFSIEASFANCSW